jgi:hypothetical protein
MSIVGKGSSGCSYAYVASDDSASNSPTVLSHVPTSGPCRRRQVSTAQEQMVFAEATSLLPLLASDAWHRGAWRSREKRRFAKLFE